MRGFHTILKVLITSSLIGLYYGADGQTVKDHLQKGERAYQKRDYQEALKHFEAALGVEPDHAMANFKAGMTNLNEEMYDKAILHLEKARDLNPDVDLDIDYHLGLAYQENHQFGQALAQFEKVRNNNKKLSLIASRKMAECIAADSLMKIPVGGSVKPVGGEINTAFSEFAPVISADGKSLIFTSNRSTNEYELKTRTNPNDVYVSEWSTSGWSSPKSVGSSINVKSNKVATAQSSDGSTLFLCYDDGGGDIYTSTSENGEWARPVPLNRFVNNPQYRESAACISPDGKRLYFSSNRAGGRGGYDIYVCELGENGQWGRPSNLGSGINTRGDELSPFLHADGKTLYFSSNGHPSLGDQDIFKSVFDNGKWSVPRNLGYPINTKAFEAYFTLTPDDSKGFFTSLRNGKSGDMDIYTIDFYQPADAGTSRPEEEQKAEQ